MTRAQLNAKRARCRCVGIWLALCAIVVYVMISIGGITRLTQSGLSMVEWEPIMGTIPPLSDKDWAVTFSKYQTSPEYLKVNLGMTLPEFKKIFWWEYGHRVLGRFIGILFFFPFLFFAVKGYLSGRWKIKLIGVFALGGLQAVVGWYMVKSGLVNNPHVSQYRLAAHFGIALLIFTLLVWFALEFLRGQTHRVDDVGKLKGKTFFVLCLVLFMMLTGAFVAGTKAGHIYNTFPLMAGAWVPDGLLAMQPVWRNFFENSMTIQFVHRCLAYFVGFSVLALFLYGRKRIEEWPILNYGKELLVVLVLVICQIGFGIITLINKVPLFWGALHQATAVALLTSLLFLLHKVVRNYH